MVNLEKASFYSLQDLYPQVVFCKTKVIGGIRKRCVIPCDPPPFLLDENYTCFDISISDIVSSIKIYVSISLICINLLN